MNRLIDLNECAKIMGCKRTQLAGSVIRILEGFPQAEIPGKTGQIALFDEKKIIAWSKKHDCEKEIKKAYNFIYKRKKTRLDGEISKELRKFDRTYCSMFLRGRFDPLEKRIEYETRRYTAMQNQPETLRIQVKSNWL